MEARILFAFEQPSEGSSDVASTNVAKEKAESTERNTPSSFYLQYKEAFLGGTRVDCEPDTAHFYKRAESIPVRLFE